MDDSSYFGHYHWLAGFVDLWAEQREGLDSLPLGRAKFFTLCQVQRKWGGGIHKIPHGKH